MWKIRLVIIKLTYLLISNLYCTILVVSFFSFFHHNIIVNKPYPKKPPIKKHNNHNSNLLKNFIYSLNILFTFFFNVFIFNISVIIITLSQSPFKIFICRNWFKLVWLICKVFYHHITAGINKIWH
jgi:hypothetical protein